MNKILLRPVRKIRLLHSATSEELFDTSCLDGRAKWTEETGILSIKIQVSEDATGSAELIDALEAGVADYDIEILAGGGDENLVANLFRNFTPSKVETRSFATGFPFTNPGVWRYFIEGHASGRHSSLT